MTITPLGKRILVKRTKAKDTTEGGVLLAEQSIEKSLEGEIVALGVNNVDDKGNDVPFNVKVGDRVTFATWGSELDIDMDDVEYSFINEDTIIGILN